LSKKDGKFYRLRTEAEWEYSCRAGSSTAYSCGDDVDQLGQHAWFRSNAFALGQRHARQVGQKLPNSFGLFDMHGNVDEWCSDKFEDGYYVKAPDKDEGGSTSGTMRICRGSAWNMPADKVRSAFRRARDLSAGPIGSIGFRVVAEAL